MPPSATASYTTPASSRPDCGRASGLFSIMTAITGRLLTSNGTCSPVSFDASVVGFGGSTFFSTTGGGGGGAGFSGQKTTAAATEPPSKPINAQIMSSLLRFESAVHRSRKPAMSVLKRFGFSFEWSAVLLNFEADVALAFTTFGSLSCTNSGGMKSGSFSSVSSSRTETRVGVGCFATCFADRLPSGRISLTMTIL